MLYIVRAVGEKKKINILINVFLAPILNVSIRRECMLTTTRAKEPPHPTPTPLHSRMCDGLPPRLFRKLLETGGV